MNVYFSSAHLQTLCELKALAEKHNCFITFGVDNYHDLVEYEKFNNYSENVIKEFNDHGYFCTDSESGNVTFCWFQLYDPSNLVCRYHGLKYITGWQQVGYVLNDDNSLSEELTEFLENNRLDFADYEYANKVLYTNLAYTEITGFIGQQHPSVYREGMTLKFFSDLVCDYLNEPRIERNY